MSGFVVDASVVIKWFVDESGSDLAIRLLDHPLAAPDLLYPECANILWKKVARGELAPGVAESAAAILQDADIVLHPTRVHLLAALGLACTLQHPAYDCFYLALAQQLSMPLVTADQRLIAMVRARAAHGLADLVVPLAGFGP